MIGLFQKIPNRGDLGHTFLKKKYVSGSFKFVLDPWKFFCYTPWKCQGQKPRLMKIKHSITLGSSVKLCSTLWWPLEIALLFQLSFRSSTWYLFNTPGNSMSSTPHPSLCLDFSLCLYIYRLFDHLEEGAILKVWGNHPRMKLWYRGEEFLIKNVFCLTHKENQGRKPRKY